MRIFENDLFLHEHQQSYLRAGNKPHLHSLPGHRVKEDIDSLFSRIGELLNLGRWIFGHPQSMQHVISPIPGRPKVPPDQNLSAHFAGLSGNLQFSDYHLLHDITRHRVKDVE